MKPWELTKGPQMVVTLYNMSPYNAHTIVQNSGRCDWSKAEREAIRDLIKSGHLARAEKFAGWNVTLTGKGLSLACHVLNWMDENI